jgi:hypothetical protein
MGSKPHLAQSTFLGEDIFRVEHACVIAVAGAASSTKWMWVMRCQRAGKAGKMCAEEQSSEACPEGLWW